MTTWVILLISKCTNEGYGGRHSHDRVHRRDRKGYLLSNRQTCLRITFNNNIHATADMFTFQIG